MPQLTVGDALPRRLHGIELTKPSGKVYQVNLSGLESTCSCPGFEKHGWHADENGEPTACKHVMALLKLQKLGKL